MKMLRYITEIIEDMESHELDTLDYWLVTRGGVSAIGSMYEDEIQDESFTSVKDWPMVCLKEVKMQMM